MKSIFTGESRITGKNTNGPAREFTGTPGQFAPVANPRPNTAMTQQQANLAAKIKAAQKPKR